VIKYLFFRKHFCNEYHRAATMLDLLVVENLRIISKDEVALIGKTFIQVFLKTT